MNSDLSDKRRAYKGWESYRIVLTYDWFTWPDEPPKRVPVTIFTEGVNGRHDYWCRGYFTDYRMYGAKAKLLAGASQ
jgi:hypothetical protein